MKNLVLTFVLLLTVSFAFAGNEVEKATLSLNKLTTFKTVKVIKKDVREQTTWYARCADGTIGGIFTCDCSQSQANRIAHTMCE